MTPEQISRLYRRCISWNLDAGEAQGWVEQYVANWEAGLRWDRRSEQWVARRKF